MDSVPLKRPRKCKVHVLSSYLVTRVSYPCRSVRLVEAQADRLIPYGVSEGWFAAACTGRLAVLGWGKEDIFKVLIWTHVRRYVSAPFFSCSNEPCKIKLTRHKSGTVVNMRINICSHCSHCKLAKSPARKYSQLDSTITIPDAANSTRA